MRGPHDERIQAEFDAGQQLAAPVAAPDRVPGGKALLRLTHLLHSAGLAPVADAVIDGALGDERNDAVRDLLTRVGATPTAGQRQATPAPDALARAEIAGLYVAAAQLLAGPPPPGSVPWRSLGPWTIPNGQTYGSSRVNVSGRISAIAVDPSNPAHVLAGAANGGVWESADRGATWTARTDDAPTLTVGAITFDPSSPGVVLCGTGEGNWWSWLGAGILRSSDGGTTWSTLCTQPFAGQGFYDLRIDPTLGTQVFAATTGGLYASSDSGATWQQRRGNRTWSLALPSQSATEIFAGCVDGVFESTNGGTTWAAVALPGAPTQFDRLAVAIAPSDATVAYAWGASGPNAYLWQRTSGTWTALTVPPGVSTGQAWYDWFLAIAPDESDRIYCGAIDAYRGELAGGTPTWTDITSKPAPGDSIHPDQHAIAFEPGNPDRLYVGCDGGLFSSPDRGTTWDDLNHGLVISEFEYLAQDDASANWLIGGTQDNGTERWTGSPTWDHVADGDGGDCAVIQSNPQVVWHTYYNMSPEVSTAHGDWGSWTYRTPPNCGGSLFYPPAEASDTTGDTFAIGGDCLDITRDEGVTWQSLAYPTAARSSALAMPDGDTVLVGTTDGRIYKTTWDGANWVALAPLTTPRANAYVSDLEVAGQAMWATYRAIGGGRVFRSTDVGSSWTDQSAGLSSLPINAIQIDPADTNRVWVAADLGVYESPDGGTSWHVLGAGLPNAFVGDLLFNPTGRVLRAGMRNRGVWELPVDGTSTPTAALYRYWNPTIADHFYTTDWTELGGGASGWNYEGVTGYVFASSEPGTVPLYRYWNPTVGDHFYTTDWSELGNGRAGWSFERIQCYVYPAPRDNSTPLFRYWNPTNSDHFYTADWSELGAGNYGYTCERIQCYIYPAQ